MPTRSYDEGLLERLQDPEAAAEYLTACFEDSEEVFLLGLRSVVEAHGGVRKLAEGTELNREALYRLLSEEGNPRLSSLSTILRSLGLQLQFAAASAA
jgi:probable addiction module antidote protein